MGYHGRTWVPLYKEIANEGLKVGTFQESAGKAIHLYVDSEYYSWSLLCGLYGLWMHKKHILEARGVDMYLPEQATCGNCLRLYAKSVDFREGVA